ncbi:MULTISPECIES: C40 family peptidase [Methanosarcina]|uniref:Cell surface protein n=1 Tax=Methanosarcina vacuolata Z-761 TaxID=1434123 RepID=A0A0E3Q756_9EURY|nr:MULTISPECIES: NlpC/P60 family protein [Methanosarcina]AKB44404.1 cell surface protein [Methanosarcina vacuolata Z-761]AKB47908.1 cell surface protein [Methanosarcina sp. Kolksee]
MKISKERLIVTFLLAILIAFIPLGAAAPVGTSENATLEAANNWLGVKSVHGGNNTTAIDCSHLVYQVYSQVGAKDIFFQKVPDMKNNTDYVNTSSPAPGDVIFWQKDVPQNGRIYWLATHVGIYIGNNQFIDTSFDTKNVTTENITGVYEEGMPYFARWSRI